jgi:magnesium chelatase family protein
MWAKVTSIGLKGMEGYCLNVEVGTYLGMDSFKIVGLPDAAVKESKDRILAALRTLGYTLHGQKIIINLSPAEQKKSGPMYDLPMAIGLLMSLHELEVTISEDTGFVGALSLDGSLKPVEGMLPAVLAAKKIGLHKLFIPFDGKMPDLVVEGMEIIYVSSLQEVIDILTGKGTISIFRRMVKQEDESKCSDLQQIIGHTLAKKALEVAAAGGHHVLMTGPPGCGKSMLAESFPSILPTLTKQAQLEVLSLYQLGGNSYPNTNLAPFRNPHHSASGVSIIGGGQYPKPGEISLAHRGILFLDEIGEFSKKTLDMLRQPMETGKVAISRTHATITYPADFLLVAAMNPCPCGYTGSNTHYCTCSPKQISSYQNKLSGPLRDRFDINLLLSKVDIKKESIGECSKIIQKRVDEARQRQYERYGREICNGRATYDELIKSSPLTAKQQRTLQELSYKNDWSNRTQIKIIRLARTISDLQNSDLISDESIWRAIKLNTCLNS